MKLINLIINSLFKTLFIVFIIASFYPTIAQDSGFVLKDSTQDSNKIESNKEETIIFSKDTLIKKNQKIPLNIGIQGGYHSIDLNKNSRSFEGNISLGLYLKFDFSNEIYLLIGYSYWKSHTKEIVGSNLYFPAETIISKGVKFELDFSILKNKYFSLMMGPSFLIESVSTAHSSTFSFGVQTKLNYALWNDKLFLISTLAYQTGGAAFDLAGGGFDYSFFNYSLGIEVNLTK